MAYFCIRGVWLVEVAASTCPGALEQRILANAHPLPSFAAGNENRLAFAGIFDLTATLKRKDFTSLFSSPSSLQLHRKPQLLLQLLLNKT